MQRHPEVDVVTVGTGWTASIIAQQLTQAGLEVVSLERGRAQWTWPNFAHNHDQLKYSARDAMMQDLSRETLTWRPRPGAPTLPFREHSSHMVGQHLGGSGVHWSALSWRAGAPSRVFDHSDLDFIGGAHLRTGEGESDPIEAVNEITFLPGSEGEDGSGGRQSGSGGNGNGERQWGQAYKDAMHAAYNSTFTLGMHAEDIAFEYNFLDLDPRYRDVYGLPLLRVTHDWSDNQRNLHRFLADRLAEIMAAMNPTRISVERELDDFGIAEGAIAPTGGAIMGTEPGNSVTNKYGQVWDAPNVFFTGATLYPQNPGGNPTETVCTLAHYTTDAIKRDYLNRPEELMA